MADAVFLTTFYDDWKIISMAAAAISIVGASMLIMLSRLFSLQNLEQEAKKEFVFAATTVLIVIMAVAIIQSIEPMLAGGTTSFTRCLYLNTFGCDCVCNDPATCPQFNEQQTLIDWVKLYMATPASCVQDFMDVLYALSIPVEAMASVFIEIFMSEHASGFGMKWMAERIKTTTQSLSFYTYIYFVLIHILNFIKYYAGFFFSVGVALRAFPPTRGIGAYLMAVTFGLYFVFPLSYVLVAAMSLPHVQADMIQAGGIDADGAVVPIDTAGGASCTRADGGGLLYTCGLPEKPDISYYACESASVSRVFELPDRVSSNWDILEDMIFLRINNFVRHIVSTLCLFPVVAMFIFFTFVLNTSNLFGGNIPEIGRGLVKLI